MKSMAKVQHCAADRNIQKYSSVVNMRKKVKSVVK